MLRGETRALGPKLWRTEERRPTVVVDRLCEAPFSPSRCLKLQVDKDRTGQQMGFTQPSRFIPYLKTLSFPTSRLFEVGLW